MENNGFYRNFLVENILAWGGEWPREALIRMSTKKLEKIYDAIPAEEAPC